MPKLLADAKGAILRAVREHLPTEGWAALNIRTIAERAGIAQGTIYNYFPSREAIAAELIQADWRAIAECGPAFVPSPEAATANLALLFAELADFMAVYRRLWTDEIPADATHPKAHGPEERAGFREYLERLVTLALSGRATAPGIPEGFLAPFLAGAFLEWSRVEGFEYPALDSVVRRLLSTE